jgi:ribosomal protein S18 acetylase RimI-like enzyme
VVYQPTASRVIIMDMARREYSGETDLRTMAGLVHVYAADDLHAVDLPYRLSSWALDFPENIRLWHAEDGSLLGWAVMQTPFWTIDYAYRPAAGPALHQEIVAWADARAAEIVGLPSGHPAWYVAVFADQLERMRDLEAAGFVSQASAGEDSWSQVLLQHSTRARLDDPSSPAGITIRPLSGPEEAPAYVELHRTVFESKNMTEAWRVRTLHRPEYVQDADLVAVAPDGRLAAFCICWLHRNSGGTTSGQIEPAGVHPDFRRLGLGRAIISEALRRLRRLGAVNVCVLTDNYRNAALNLYRAVGFQVLREVLIFRKDYTG